MDPNHVQNFCANMFQITGRQIDQLRELLSTSNNISDGVLTPTGSGTAGALIEGADSGVQMGQVFAVLLLIMSFYLMYNDRNHQAASLSQRQSNDEEDNGLEKPHHNHFDGDYRGGGGDDSATT